MKIGKQMQDLLDTCERVANELQAMVSFGDKIAPEKLASRIAILRAAIAKAEGGK